jgi:hypothetical protein
MCGGNSKSASQKKKLSANADMQILRDNGFGLNQTHIIAANAAVIKTSIPKVGIIVLIFIEI